MKTLNKQQLAIINIKDLASILMLSSKHFDMSTIQHCVDIEMQETGLRFKEYFKVLAENPDAYLQTPHDTTEDYFYDAINCMNINEDKINLLVDLCIQ